MSHTAKLPRQHSKSYHYHHHLLIQFILSELILAHDEIKDLDKIFTDPSNSRGDIIETVIRHISKLSGSTQGYMRLFSWNDDGILTKLKNYCAFFCQNARSKNNDQFSMYQEANQAWLFSLHALDISRMIAQQDTAWDVDSLYNSVKKIGRSIQRLSRLAAKVIPQFRNNENVVFFLLRHVTQLDSLYGDGFATKLLRKMFTKRSQGVSNFLTKRYAERGFDHLIPNIQSKLAALNLYPPLETV